MKSKTYDSKTFKIILAGSIGNMLEWYDFALYGFFAPIIAQLFFPSGDHLTSLISTFGVFAAGFLMRPLGAVIFGSLGDRWGRKKALIISTILMAIPTALIGLLPTHQQAGVLAPVLLTLCRLLQGVSVGGELPTSISFLVEKAPAHRRGFFGSWAGVSSMAGILLGSSIGALVTSLFSPEILLAWGWRIPFLLGIVTGVIGFVVREGLEEPESFKKVQEKGEISRAPVKDAIKHHYREILTVVGITWIHAVCFYTLFVYMTTYISEQSHVLLSTSLKMNAFGMVFLVCFIPFVGHLADRFGRKPILITGSVLLIIFSYPLFLFILQGNNTVDFLVQIGFALLVATMQGTVHTVIAEQFPTKVRLSAVSIGYNVGQAIFGGTTPLIASYLIKTTGIPASPAFYLILAAVGSLLVFIRLRETREADLD